MWLWWLWSCGTRCVPLYECGDETCSYCQVGAVWECSDGWTEHRSLPGGVEEVGADHRAVLEHCDELASGVELVTDPESEPEPTDRCPGRVECNDGTCSPTCVTCDAGCCSQHGGCL